MTSEGIFLGERYELMSKIGTGGMADVYKAKDHKLNRFVAVKILKREFREDESFVKKFKVEAQSAAGLMHPNVVNVYDVGEERGLHFMVMELVEGITLKEYIQKKERLTSKEVISITIQIATGIESAHMQHIIHRDIKPQNVIISKEGKVKVTDFGIAKATTSNTISSNAMGSVHYTSPEQARGGFSDAKSDVYSLGITMYEMITGRVPFDGETTVTVAIKHLQEEIIPPSELVRNIPYGLEQIILKCTQKSADRRYQDMSSLMLDLKRALVDPEGDFVVIAPFIKGTETVMITKEELETIKNQRTYDDDYDDYDDDDYDDDDYDDDDYDDDEDYKTEKKSKLSKNKHNDVNTNMKKINKILLIVVVIIIAFVAIYLVGKAVGMFKNFGSGTNTSKEESSMIKVPNLVGLTETQASDALKKRGLVLEVESKKESKKYEAGLVSEQKTAVDKKVKKGSKIQVVVSSGKAGIEVEIPNVVGQSEADAAATLSKKGLTANPTFAFHETVAEGKVISISPEAGAKVAKETVVTLVISKGVQKAVVPEVVGMSTWDAEQTFIAAGLVLGSVAEEHSESVAGTVLSQGIKAGKELPSGSSVNIVISKGPKEVKITVPELNGETKEAAIQALIAKGLNYTVREEVNVNVTVGRVISASHQAGAQVAVGTTVEIVISKAPEPEPEKPVEEDKKPEGSNS